MPRLMTVISSGYNLCK